MGPGTVVTTISSTANSRAPEVKVTEVKGVPLKERDPSGKVKTPPGTVPLADALPPALVESSMEVVFCGSFRANKKLILSMG
jgi:hypothetical protein